MKINIQIDIPIEKIEGIITKEIELQAANYCKSSEFKTILANVFARATTPQSIFNLVKPMIENNFQQTVNHAVEKAVEKYITAEINKAKFEGKFSKLLPEFINKFVNDFHNFIRAKND